MTENLSLPSDPTLIDVDIINSIDVKGDKVKQGFMDYADASTASGVSVTAETWTYTANDGKGSTTESTYKPGDVTQLVDTSTGAIDLSGLNLGDSVLIRLDLKITPSINNALLEVRLELGTDSISKYYLTQSPTRLDDGAKEYELTFTEYVYLGNTLTKDNPIRPQIRLSEDGSYITVGYVIQVFRN